MDNPYYPPGSEYAAPKRTSIGKWILWGCGGALLLFLSLGLACFVLIKGAMKVGDAQLGPACSEYLAMVGKKDLSGAYKLMGEAGKAEISEARHNAIIGGITEKLGPIKSMKVESVETGVDRTGSWGKITYDTEFQNGPGTIHVELRKESGHFKVVGIQYQSPLLAEAINKALAKPD